MPSACCYNTVQSERAAPLGLPALPAQRLQAPCRPCRRRFLLPLYRLALLA